MGEVDQADNNGNRVLTGASIVSSQGMALTKNTRLTQINGGTAAKPNAFPCVAAQADEQITLSDGTQFTVSFAGATTILDVLNDLKQAVPASDAGKFLAEINGNGLELIDQSHGTTTNFVVASVNDSMDGMIGCGLGIEGEVNSADASGNRILQGSSLDGDSLVKHAYLLISGPNSTPATISGTIQLTASNVNASALLGFVGLQIVGGTANISEGFNVTLKDPGGDNDGKITMDEMTAALAAPSTLAAPPAITGSASLNLPITANLLGTPLSGHPAMTVTWSDITDPLTLVAGYNADLAPVLDVQHVSAATITAALQDAGSYLNQLTSLSFLKDKLPVVNKSVADLLGMNSRLTDVITNFAANPAQLLSADTFLNVPGQNDLQITLSDGTAFQVSFTGATTIGDVLNDLNQAAPAGKFQARIDDQQLGLELINQTGGKAANFVVAPVNGSMAGATGFGLGIDGEVNSADATGNLVLQGSSLTNGSDLTDSTPLSQINGGDFQSAPGKCPRIDPRSARRFEPGQGLV